MRDLRGDVSCLLVALTLPCACPQVSGEILPGKHVDRGLYPKSYGVLASEHLMFPVDMSGWPVRIDRSHQLLVDDYLIASTDGIDRQVHQAKKHARNPIMVGRKPWERFSSTREGIIYQIVRRDEKTGRFRMWYAGFSGHTLPCGVKARFPGLYAESADGITWERPELGLHAFDRGSKANNIIIPGGHIAGLFIEPNAPNPDQRYKALVWHEPSFGRLEDGQKGYVDREGYYLYTSPDGVRWSGDISRCILPSLAGYTLPQTGIGDTSLFRWDPRLGKYIGDVKFVLPPKMRCRGIMESDDLIHWSRPRMTVYPDGIDGGGSQIYAHTGFVYESMWIGLVRVMRAGRAGARKQTTVELTASRDGRHWTRVGKREEIIPLGKPDAWDADYHDPFEGPVVVGDELWIYYRSARMRGDVRKYAIGLVTLRRDGFVSLNAREKPGTIVTRPLTFDGKALFVNAEVGKDGYVKAELQDASGKALGPYLLSECKPLSSDTLRARITWNAKDTIEHAPRTPLRLVFELSSAKLYSFWIE